MLFACDNWAIGSSKSKKQKLYGDYTCSFFQSFSSIEKNHWDQIIGGGNLFLRLNYLQILETIKSSNISMRYAIVYRNDIPVMIAYFQIVDFTVEVFGAFIAEQFELIKNKKASLFENYLSSKKDVSLMRLVTLGNNFVSGEYGILATDEIDRKEVFKLQGALSTLLAKNEKLRGKISATLVKDFYSTTVPENQFPLGDKYIPFSVEPNMIIDLPSVKTLSDYISCFSKKYRNRAKSIFKASERVEVRELNGADILEKKEEIFSLYLQVFNHAKFKLVCLNPDYFYQMKINFPDEFRLFGFFMDNKMLSFCSCLLPAKSEILYGHYLGFDYELNKSMELYQNMLYKYIEVAIQTNRSKVNLGRTASEIKSTVGARAHDLTCFIKPQNTLSKLILKPFISYLQPSQWIPRNPFKEE